ncbi:MAG: Hsp33 family molecular chaperone HslO [Gammaproteobacteria bacterium]
MPDNDRLYRFLIENSHVRGELVHLNATWQAVLERADYPDTVKTVLGEALAACALLAATIKFDGSLILQIRGDGPLHLLVVQTTSEGSMRAIARWNNEVPEQGLHDIFGQGQMVITIEPKDGEAYQGIVALEGEHLKDALEAYFIQSEQLNTRLWLAADINSCGGFLLQELPSDENDDIRWEHFNHLASTLQPEEILNLPAQELLHRLFHEEDIRLFDPEPMCFRCTCSKHRISSMLLSLGSDEVHDILEQQGNIEVDCEFCNAHYEFDRIDVDALFAPAIGSTTATKH